MWLRNTQQSLPSTGLGLHEEQAAIWLTSVEYPLSIWCCAGCWRPSWRRQLRVQLAFLLSVFPRADPLSCGFQKERDLLCTLENSLVTGPIGPFQDGAQRRGKAACRELYIIPILVLTPHSSFPGLPQVFVHHSIQKECLNSWDPCAFPCF